MSEDLPFQVRSWYGLIAGQGSAGLDKAHTLAHLRHLG